MIFLIKGLQLGHDAQVPQPHFTQQLRLSRVNAGRLQGTCLKQCQRQRHPNLRPIEQCERAQQGTAIAMLDKRRHLFDAAIRTGAVHDQRIVLVHGHQCPLDTELLPHPRPLDIQHAFAVGRQLKALDRKLRQLLCIDPCGR